MRALPRDMIPRLEERSGYARATELYTGLIALIAFREVICRTRVALCEMAFVRMRCGCVVRSVFFVEILLVKCLEFKINFFIFCVVIYEKCAFKTGLLKKFASLYICD